MIDERVVTCAVELAKKNRSHFEINVWGSRPEMKEGAHAKFAQAPL